MKVRNRGRAHGVDGVTMVTWSGSTKSTLIWLSTHTHKDSREKERDHDLFSVTLFWIKLNQKKVNNN